eukprot:134539-Pelagomonas_calceolata.AAC.1
MALKKAMSGVFMTCFVLQFSASTVMHALQCFKQGGLTAQPAGLCPPNKKVHDIRKKDMRHQVHYVEALYKQLFRHRKKALHFADEENEKQPENSLDAAEKEKIT